MWYADVAAFNHRSVAAVLGASTPHGIRADGCRCRRCCCCCRIVIHFCTSGDIGSGSGAKYAQQHVLGALVRRCVRHFRPDRPARRVVSRDRRRVYYLALCWYRRVADLLQYRAARPDSGFVMARDAEWSA